MTAQTKAGYPVQPQRRPGSRAEAHDHKTAGPQRKKTHSVMAFGPSLYKTCLDPETGQHMDMRTLLVCLGELGLSTTTGLAFDPSSLA